MDPNLFHIDWDRTLEVLVAIVVLSFFVERALALVFENRHFVAKFKGKGVKEIIAFAVAFLICWRWEFDAISMIILAEETSIPGEAITAGVIAGGSKASIALFHNVMGVKSAAIKAKEADEAAAKAGNP